ncbi:WD repeat-containing protein on Y chromosome-like isoform X2 [Lytechinus variegatus]|uniref:WD repeat-containing protein on Y chromosome-like isoform X2 n=1 Tax=Lytechinus variegatus TaxID=7654 RepID=UPI001BB25936|nr:WD repeat-containing protein on Y chromosome-like isoform X2 [Lytechinus variegatus]
MHCCDAMKGNDDFYVIEEKINLDDLHSLKKFFEEADVDQNGTLSLDEFKTVLRGSLSLRTKNDEEITNLFMKIDFNSEGTIDWDEFCTYMQLEYEEKEDAYLRKKEVDLHTPAVILSSPHREPVLRVTNMSDGTCVTTSQDGTIAFWSGNMDLKRWKSVMVEQNTTRQKPKWVTDFVMMTQFNKIIVGTGDREIQFYELSTFEPYCQVTGLETTPLKLTYCATGFDECYLMYGDSEGCINIIIINGVGETLRTWKKLPKTEGIASVTLEKVAHSPLTQFVRWKVHDDWVGDIKYYDDIRSIISCSNSENTALVIGCTIGSTHVESKLKDGKEHLPRPTTADKRAKLSQMHYSHAKKRLDNDETIFKIHKGVKTFDFCKEKNLIATGGMDRILRLWNPYVPSKPTGMLRGHNAPIFSLFIAPAENRIYSISQDKTIKVWDTKDQVCMLTIRPKTHKIRGDLQAAHYNITSKAFIVATDQMAMLTHRVKSLELREIPTTHRTPILCARYNSEFKNVVTTSDASVVKLWDFETGHLVFEFSQAHNNSAITALTFDNTGRRLITGGRDGRLKIWNYNNGHCLKMLEKADGNDEVTDVVYIEMNKNRYVISVGWDRSINVYTDSSEDFRHIQRPMPRWTDDEKNGHQEDILSVSACPPSLLATSSYDGEIIVWNLVSGYAYSHIQSTKYFDDHDERYKADGDESISKVLFIPSRRTHKGAAQLVASGPRGCIHFWNVYNNGQLYGRFNCVKKKGASVNCMQLSNDDLTLFTGDSLGFVSVWDIDHYCLDRPENIEEAPELLGSWRGHIQSITSMNLVEEHSILITSSLDCTVRLWTTEGHYVGTFGQDDPWDIFNPTTFKHPMVPYDVLVDPQSMPNHPIFDQKSTSSVSDYICDESLDDGQAGGDVDILDDGSSQGDENGEKEEVEEREDDKKSESTSYISTDEKFVYDDEMIAAELKKKPFNRGSGKRLRHEKLRSMPKERAVTSAYQTLKCFDLEDTPPLAPPTRSKDKTSDPFTFS